MENVAQQHRSSKVLSEQRIKNVKRMLHTTHGSSENIAEQHAEVEN
jgi:hypothetical protein